jgi:hypothetical protein
LVYFRIDLSIIPFSSIRALARKSGNPRGRARIIAGASAALAIMSAQCLTFACSTGKPRKPRP